MIGVGINKHEVDTISKGDIHIVEPDQHMVFQASVEEEVDLRAITEPEPAEAVLMPNQRHFPSPKVNVLNTTTCTAEMANLTEKSFEVKYCFAKRGICYLRPTKKRCTGANCIL